MQHFQGIGPWMADGDRPAFVARHAHRALKLGLYLGQTVVVIQKHCAPQRGHPETTSGGLGHSRRRGATIEKQQMASF